MTTSRRARLLSLVLAVAWAAPAAAATPVPPGNRHAEQPAIPSGAVRRTDETRSTFEAKYEKIRNLLATNTELQNKIRAAAKAYGIAPIHIAGALVGEHTYNVDALDRLQTYYVKAASYMTQRIEFSYKGEGIDDFLARPEFAACRGARGDAALWSCREAVYEQQFRGRSVDGRSYPNNRFGAVFFQPLFAGQTFGLGQLNPLTALSVSDRVHATSGYPKLSERKAGAVYGAIMDPDKSLSYMAAVIRTAIDSYGEAGFDISGNPGLTATLYNVGDAAGRARALAAENERRRAAGESPRLPEENYYGWLVNNRIADLQAIFP